MAGEVAVKKTNFLPVILFQALPMAVSGEAIKNGQPQVQGVAADPSLPESGLGTRRACSQPSPDRRGEADAIRQPQQGHWRQVLERRRLLE